MLTTTQIYLSLFDTSTGQLLLKLPVSDMTACHQLGAQYMLVLKGAASYLCGF